MWIGIFCEFIFALLTTYIVYLPAPYFQNTTNAYKIVFDPTIRFVFAGFTGLLCGEFLSLFLLVKWKIKLNGKLFCLRNIGAIASGQLLLSIIVDIIAFFGKIPFNALLIAIGSGFIWKISITLIFIYPIWIITQYIKSIEDIDYYDIGTNFNPFKI
ncbi:MAG: VUT family protein [Burkholderiales bacterium]|nr:VUT family protein [Burkholderiales bacterium]